MPSERNEVSNMTPATLAKAKKGLTSLLGKDKDKVSLWKNQQTTFYKSRKTRPTSEEE